ncbi:MAG: hypothetical protein IAI49_06380, partial [Candidatus Eremiobacteraeota bacterium]|nr:hypothetical protein [Candidatus Eremiobacteraeota bacterium]
MRGFRLFLFFLIVLIIIVALFVSRCDRRGSSAADGCGPGTVAGECKAHIDVGQLGYSVWTDGTLAVAIPVENQGGRGAGNVHVNAISVGAGTRTSPTVLPVLLGEIAPHRRGVVQSTFHGLSNPGDYTLTVAGTYEDHGTTQTFQALSPLKLRPRVTTPIPTVSAVLTKQHTSGTPVSPSPIRGEGDDGNQVGPPLPLGQKLSPFPVAPKVTPVSQAPPPGGSAAGITFDRDTGL